MKQFLSEIVSNKQINENFFELSFSKPSGPVDPLPGQFLTVRIPESKQPLLRRPFAFSNANDKTCSIIYQVRGDATKALSLMKPGNLIDILGPIGKPFTIPHGKVRAILAAGGIGLGPILFLSSFLNEKGFDSTLIFGCKNANFIPECDSFKKENPVICTDDGSRGFKGTVRDYLETIKDVIDESTILYCCGPHPMLQSCQKYASERKIPCQVSVEQIMACGVGACMGCVVKVKSGTGYARACKDGPVFDSEELVW
jgi:dihydroorotate dehydrogenase electron transfer subunit